jgi:hypothetical protein
MMLATYHPYIQASIVTGNNYAKYLNIQKGGKIYGDEYKFDYEERRIPKDKINTIFVGNKQECVLILIEDDSPEEAYIQSFAHFPKCEIGSNLPRQSGTIKFMETTLMYLKEVHKIKVVKLSDTSKISCGGKKLYLSKLYLFKYNSSYYKHNFGFKYIPETVRHRLPYIKTIKNNIEKLKTHYCDKQDIEQMLLKTYNRIRVKKFMDKVNDNELLSSFVRRYIKDDNECDIYFDFINYMYDINHYGDVSGAVLYKKL